MDTRPPFDTPDDFIKRRLTEIAEEERSRERFRRMKAVFSAILRGLRFALLYVTIPATLASLLVAAFTGGFASW